MGLFSVCCSCSIRSNITPNGSAGVCMDKCPCNVLNIQQMLVGHVCSIFSAHYKFIQKSSHDDVRSYAFLIVFGFSLLFLSVVCITYHSRYLQIGGPNHFGGRNQR